MLNSPLLTSICLPACTTVFLVFAIERFLAPGTLNFWRRSWGANALHAGLCILAFTLGLAVFRRPYFAGLIVVAFFLFLVLVNNAKFHSLREPFIFQDFDYFLDAIKHPRLYLPFFGLCRAVVVAVGGMLAFWAGIQLELAITSQHPVAQFMVWLTGLASCGGTFLIIGCWQGQKMSLAPESDLLKNGMLTCLFHYYWSERNPQNINKLCKDSSIFNSDNCNWGPTAELPNLMVVQSESFFDARPLFQGIRPDVLKEFDAIQAAASLSGKLSVPAWGANTVRTEFAFLSALSESQTGIHRFNPYRKLVKENFPTIASYLKHLGYRTVCVHPYPASFYQRDRVFSLMGFDEFIDIASFDKTILNNHASSYVSDADVAEKVCELLNESSSGPIFIFVITMENHGPLHLEKVLPGEIRLLYTEPPPDKCEDLTIYLRHLVNADQMARTLREHVASLARPGWFCWYGDHVPIMPQVYQEFGSPDSQTDYFIVGPKSEEVKKLNVCAYELSAHLIRLMRFGVSQENGKTKA
ncbi:MAG: rkpI [Solimicrobium sp.]|nr:rkpI [Solimicrobium sp.]